ncbi:MAG: glutamate racemase [Methylophilus sp.]
MTSLSLNDAPIGVMDSGVGGISVLKHIHAALPHENLIYFADSKYAPYGNKTSAQIERRVFSCAKFLLTRGAKALVIACNTATAAAAQSLRDKYAFLDIPIIAMEPAVKPAAAASKNGTIGVLATVGTLKSAQFAALLENYGREVKVVTQACVGLVECIERGELNTAETRILLTQYCEPLLNAGADTIVLGCTHYPFVKDVIQEIVGQNISLIDTGAAVARQVKHRLDEKNLLTNSNTKADIAFWTNSQDDKAEDVIAALWGSSINVYRALS